MAREEKVKARPGAIPGKWYISGGQHQRIGLEMKLIEGASSSDDFVLVKS